MTLRLSNLGPGGRVRSPRVRGGVDLGGRGRGRRGGVFPETTLNFLDSLQTRPDPTRPRPRSPIFISYPATRPPPTRPLRVECCFFPKVVLFFPIRIHVHSYACVCIHMHFIVFCMHSDALHSTNRLHSNAFCNHFELLHSSDARRLHSDAFSYLLHSRHVTF